MKRRSATEADRRRWQRVVDKAREAKAALAEADRLLAEILASEVDGDDDAAIDAHCYLSGRLEQAFSAVSRVNNPVEAHWAGGDNKTGVESYNWRINL